MRTTQTITTQVALAAASLNVDFNVPDWAKAGIFHWRISAVAGTTPIADCKLQAKDEVGGQLIDIDGAAFAQKTAASYQKLELGQGVIADTTGDARAAIALLPGLMRAVFTLDRTTGDETYTFTLSVDWIG